MKMFRKIAASLLAAALTLGIVLQASAATIYEENGYSFTFINNYNVSLVGWDNSSADLVIPGTLAGRNVYSIGNYSMKNKADILSVDFSNVNNLTRIGMGAFENCTGVNTEIVLPESVTAINDCAFQGCSSLPSVVINSNVSEIPDQCFYNCSSLSTVKLTDGVSRIGYYAFANGTALSRVEIPSSVSTIEESSFENTPDLVIYCREGSYAQQYADAHSIPTKLITIGDVDRDYSLTVSDATEIQKWLAEFITFDEEQLALADVDGDGEITISDATMIQFMVAA